MKKYATTATLLLACIIAPEAYFSREDFAEMTVYGHLLYHFTHVNVFHLLSNFIFLAYFKPRWATVLQSYLIASASSFMPFTGMSVPTCGMSGMCFAMIARHDVAWRVLNWRLLLFNLLFTFIPGVNWRIHFVSYTLSFITWKLYYRLKRKD